MKWILMWLVMWIALNLSLSSCTSPPNPMPVLQDRCVPARHLDLPVRFQCVVNPL